MLTKKRNIEKPEQRSRNKNKKEYLYITESSLGGNKRIAAKKVLGCVIIQKELRCQCSIRDEADIKNISPGRTNHNIPLVTLAGIASKLKLSIHLHLANHYNTYMSNTLD